MGEPGVCEAPEEVEKEGERGGEREKEVGLRGREFQEKKNGKGRNRERESAKATNLPPLITPFRIEPHFTPSCRFRRKFKGRRKKNQKT